MSKPFVVNVADAPGLSYPGTGTFAPFEDPNDRFPNFGINIHVLQPGQPNAKYHAEKVQEDFLVLGGRCTLILNGEERELKQWDFFHCPAGSEHVFVGAGDGPCWILMVGARGPGEGAHYPVNETAASTEPRRASRPTTREWPTRTGPTRPSRRGCRGRPFEFVQAPGLKR
jgi:uncharacterized cupin superfamily protein